MRRRLLLILAAVLSIFVLVLATLPWWLGAAVGRLGPRWGLTTGGYERMGYAQFALRDVEYRRGNVRVTVSRAEADTPLLWLFRHIMGKPTLIAAERWVVEVTPKTPPVPAATAPAAGARGWRPLHDRLRKIGDQLARWLPAAKTGEGIVRWRGGEIALGAATWERRTLAVTGLTFRALKADATLAFPADGNAIRLQATVPASDGAILAESSGNEVTGDLTWWGQRATVNARFAERGWLPAEAALSAENWNVPGEKLKLGAAYSAVRGGGRIEWRDGRLHADLAATGQPVPDKKVPPLEVTLRGNGDMQAFTVEAVRAVLPGITAVLSEPVTVDRQGKLRESAARFSLEADLAQQPWFPARGSVSGEARVVSGVAQSPVVEFRLAARDVVARDVAVPTVEASGQFQWPRIQVSAGSLTGQEGGTLRWKGGWDFRAKEILAASVEGELRRATLARWLPAQPQFQEIAIKAEASGPLAEARHGGELRAGGIEFRGVKPLDVALTWQGRGSEVERFAVEAAAGATMLSAAGAANADGLRLSQLELAQQDTPRLQLSQPATIRWRPALQVEGLRLAGPDSSLDASIAWGLTGSVAIAVRNVPSSLLADLVTLPGPQWRINALALTGSWDRGPMTYSAVLGAAIDLGEGRKAVVNLAGRGDKDGMKLEALRASEGTESIINATGAIPAILTPGAEKLARIDPGAPLAIDAATAPNAAFWEELAELTGLELKEPRATAHVKGTWEKPEGDVQLQITRIALDPKRFKRALPTVESLDVALTADTAGLKLDRFSLRVEGQEVKAEGRLPIAEDGWARLFKEPLAFARRGADLRLLIPKAEVAVFARFLPTYLAPKGTLHMDVIYRAEGFDGSIKLSEAATRPLGPLGVLQDVEADILLAGRTVEMRWVTAKSGGETVRLTGRLELPAQLAGSAAAQAKQLPRFDIALTGQNLPFVRRTGLLLRGDLDLKLVSTGNEVPALSGTVRLRDSLFLQDVRDLLPGGAQSKARRPPYFAIENEPLNAWRLDVNVEGDRFLRLRTTLFNGVASARFQLQGTLGEPFALGEATIDEGRVRLPFAGFEVQEGRVTLTREQPYEPQLWVTATTRRFNYDLRMELSGEASAPVLAFSSSPPLEHGQVLLMVMAGEAPKDEVAFTDQQRAARLGQFLGQSLLSSLGESENAARLSISTGEKVSRLGRETYSIEYEVNDRLSAVGEYDEFDDYNAGLKWRVYSKGGREDREKEENVERKE